MSALRSPALVNYVRQKALSKFAGRFESNSSHGFSRGQELADSGAARSGLCDGCGDALHGIF